MHDLDYDHDHDDPGPEANGLRAVDEIDLHSVGIDVGSAGTQVIFSRLRLRRLAEELSSRYVVVGREALYESPVELTPYRDDDRIDAAAVAALVSAAYEAAGLGPDEVDTGAVILTGEAVRRDNASAIGQALAGAGGRFVCVVAGHRMEALLAAFGSGAVQRSHEAGSRILHVDVGGGTTKLAALEGGRVLETAALHVGGRLIAVGEDRRIVRLEPAGREIARQVGLALVKGDRLGDADMRRMAAWMAEAVIAAVTRRPLPPEVARLHLTAPLAADEFPGGVVVSGGVAEYVYGREERDFGDLGRPLGAELRRRLAPGAFPWPLLPPGECIRATVIGASEHTVQISGNTAFLSDPGLLPRRNLQVLHHGCDLRGDVDPERVAGRIRDRFAAFDLVEGDADVALAFHWRGEPSYDRLAALARGIARGLPATLEAGRPVFLVFDGDVARSVGRLLKEELRVTSGIVAVDGIVLRDFDFVDIGRRLEPSGTIPVTVKSLVFHL